MAARATARVRRRECSDAGRRANTWRSTCQQRYHWHLEKNATQMISATGVVAYGMILCPLSSEMPPACDQASVYLSRQPRQPRRHADPQTKKKKGSSFVGAHSSYANPQLPRWRVE